MRRIKMDRDVGKNTGVYHEIMTGSVTVFLALVDLYCTLFNSSVEEKLLKSIENATARKALLFVLYFIVFNILYWLVLEAVFFFKEKSWAKRHKDLWMRGKWLHIHIKTDNAIRIGMADIQQSWNIPIFRWVGVNTCLIFGPTRSYGSKLERMSVLVYIPPNSRADFTTNSASTPRLVLRSISEYAHCQNSAMWNGRTELPFTRCSSPVSFR